MHEQTLVQQVGLHQAQLKVDQIAAEQSDWKQKLVDLEASIEEQQVQERQLEEKRGEFALQAKVLKHSHAQKHLKGIHKRLIPVRHDLSELNLAKSQVKQKINELERTHAMAEREQKKEHVLKLAHDRLTISRWRWELSPKVTPALGILTLQWIDRNFSQEGALTRAPWRKLSVNNSTVRLLSEYLTQRVENPALLSRF